MNSSKKIRFIWLILTAFSPVNLSAQNKASNYTQISSQIFRNYHPDSVDLKNCCRRGCIFIKFKVNQKRDISISFSGDADSTKFITKALTISLNILKQDARLIDFMQHSGKSIIQPFIYDYQEGCKFPEPGIKKGSEYYISYISILSDLAQSSYLSMHQMLKFNSKQTRFFEGVLLEPIEVSNVILH